MHIGMNDQVSDLYSQMVYMMRPSRVNRLKGQPFRSVKLKPLNKEKPGRAAKLSILYYSALPLLFSSSVGPSYSPTLARGLFRFFGRGGSTTYGKVRPPGVGEGDGLGSNNSFSFILDNLV